jgi:SAM-dependent methyltransferase
MINILNKLSKSASRKNLYHYLTISFNKIKKLKKKNIKVLNIGSGGKISTIINQHFSDIFSIDIDRKRKPNQVLDICDNNFHKKLKFIPSMICMFEVLEHTTKPHIAIKNVYKILKKGDYFLASVPFNFHIHDEPHDYFRFTEHGLRMLLNKFSTVSIVARNGWLESILVNFIRLDKEKNLLAKLLGKLFTVIYFLIYPLTMLTQKIIISKKLTTGYYIEAKK